MKAPFKPYRKISMTVGILFLVGTLSGIFSMALTQPLQVDGNYLQNIAMNETQWMAGTLLILVMGLPLAMVPVALFPVLRRQNEVLAMGAVVFRGVLEAICYMLMVISFLVLISLGRQASMNPDAAQLAGIQTLGETLQSAGYWIEILLAVVFSIGSIMINLLLFQMRAVPRWLSGWGLLGSTLYLIAPLYCLFDPSHPEISLSGPTALLVAPLALQEMALAGWLLVKGFSPTFRPAEA